MSLSLQNILELPTEQRQKLLAELAQLQKSEREAAKTMALPEGWQEISRAQLLVAKLIHERAEIAWKKSQAGAPKANRAIFIEGVKKDEKNCDKIYAEIVGEVSKTYADNVLASIEFATEAFAQTFAEKMDEMSRAKKSA